MDDILVSKTYNKGWSYSNVYYLQPIKDIYLIIKNYPHTKLDNRKIRDAYLKTIPDLSNKWSKRKNLEYVNALRNFGLIDQENKIIKEVFEDSEIGEELSQNDLLDFRDIFFSYFRFKEISSWYLFPCQENHNRFESITLKELVQDSIPLFATKDDKFFNKILFKLENIRNVYVVDEDLTHLMRFFEVFLKWGTTLGIMDKFNLNSINLKTQNNKDITISYFIKPFNYFDLRAFIERKKFWSRQILIPELVFEIAKEFRYSVFEIKNFIVQQILENDELTYERTSAVFIVKGKNSAEKVKAATYLYPIINDSYVSHLIIRK
ncbi:hypothetical protein [Christiangramia flava]|uniref:hypothetical protein n=1 Tax=Christiangramia flava TaxID=1486245 RepID=UPI00111BDF6F|nr:hypothetical protein [Christiangramia flava]